MASNQKTTVRCEVLSKKQSKSYIPEKPIQTEIEFIVPYNPDSIFYQMSGGTSIKLMTVNQEAADMFEIGKAYNVEISPAE